MTSLLSKEFIIWFVCPFDHRRLLYRSMTVLYILLVITTCTIGVVLIVLISDVTAYVASGEAGGCLSGGCLSGGSVCRLAVSVSRLSG